MSDKFGNTTDHFGLANTDLVLAGPGSEVPDAQSVAEALDELGDVAAFKTYGNDGDTRKAVSNVYTLKSGDLDLSTLKVGQKSSGLIIENISVATDNGAFPQITVSGIKGAVAVTAPTGKTNDFALPAITIKGVKKAQFMGFTITSVAKLQSCTLEASVDVVAQANGLGEIVAHGLSGGMGTVSANFVHITGVAAMTLAAPLDTAAEMVQKPGEEEPQAGWHTSSGSFTWALIRGTV